MTRFKLASVLLDDMRQFHEAPRLFCHSSTTVLPAGKDGIATLAGAGSFEFLTYFNGISVVKWKKYTTVENFNLHIEVKGAAAKLVQTRVDVHDYYPQTVADSATDLPASTAWAAYDLPLTVEPLDVLVSFRLETEGEVQLRNAFFYTEIEESCIRDVELAVATTTFRKESYITHNIDLVRTHILESDERISSHFRMFVIDNGRTLDAEGLSGGGITVYPNDNVGGAGGFAYGMLLAQEQTDVTHVLLMDDDVEMSPESFLRTFALLSLVNDEYKDAFLSGAMMEYDVPDNRWEDLGFMTKAGVCRALKPARNMSVLHDIIKDETFEPDHDSFADLKQTYAAWWYCCIPLTQIRKNGMPLPIFVRYDDIEYGQRCAPLFMTLNGVCVWHLGFHMRYNEAVERYQTTRNGLITQFTTGVSPQTNFLDEITHSMRIELIKFNYAAAELLLEGFEDFLKGPDFIAGRGVAEKTFMDSNKKKEKLLPLEDIRAEAMALTGRDILFLGHDEIARDIPYSGTARGPVYDMGYRAIVRNSLNGQLWGRIQPARGNTAIIEAYGYTVGCIAGVDHIVALDVPNRTGIIRHRDAERCKQLWKRFNDDVKTFHRDEKRLREAYAAARPRLTSVEFWRTYLGLES